MAAPHKKVRFLNMDDNDIPNNDLILNEPNEESNNQDDKMNDNHNELD